MRALSIALSFLVLSIAACSPGAQDAGSGDTWAGTITTEGDVTTVVNESGSVWGGTATLEEELSIGVEAGADEYMFGTIYTVHATDERIYVVDNQVPAVWTYDHEGNFQGNLGEVELPEDLYGTGPSLFVNGTMVVGHTQDEAGIYRVKRYRLVLPGETGRESL